MLLLKYNRGNVWQVARKRKIWTLLNFCVNAWPFLHYLYFIYPRKIYLRTTLKLRDSVNQPLD